MFFMSKKQNALSVLFLIKACFVQTVLMAHFILADMFVKREKNGACCWDLLAASWYFIPTTCMPLCTIN